MPDAKRNLVQKVRKPALQEAAPLLSGLLVGFYVLAKGFSWARQRRIEAKLDQLLNR